jgi:putative Ca2+/H+ antiporter (TMEM165/GDT1 family)
LSTGEKFAILRPVAVIITLAATVYITVLVAELVGDKTLYTVGTLTTTHPTPAVLAGATVAVALKMLVAVLLGGLVARLPPLAVSIVSAATFLALAAGIWFSRPPTSPFVTTRRPWARGIRVAFLGLFLTEWADFGQITAATLVAEYGRPWLVWVFASLAMFTKVAVAATLGMGFRRWVPHRILRPITTATCVLMAVLAAFRIEA